MGYYAQTIAGEVIIPKRNLGKAYRAMCELNAHHDLKRGGAFGGNEPRPKGDKGSRGIPDRWFSWMAWDYDRRCKNAQEILEALGFYTGYDEKGNLIVGGYDKKTGQEDLFFEAIAPYVLRRSYLEWEGEDGALFKWSFKGGIFEKTYRN